MNRIHKLLAIIIVALVFPSCSQMAYNKINTSVYETRQQDIDKGALPFNPVIADLQVDLSKKISGTSIRQVSRFNDLGLENTKEAALYNAVTNSGADVVVDPIFKINISNNDGRDEKVTIQSEVTGFFGKYTSIHKATTAELENAVYDRSLLYANTPTATNKNSSAVLPIEEDMALAAEKAAALKKKKRKAIGWAVGSTLILSLTLGLGVGLGMGNSYGF